MKLPVLSGTGRGLRPARTLSIVTAAAALALASQPAPALAQAVSPALHHALRDADGADRDTRAFYRARNYQPLWIQNGRIGPAAERLLDLIDSAEADGLDPGDYRPRRLVSALERAESGDLESIARAEMLLSRTLAEYVSDMRRPRRTDMVYVDQQLAPRALDRRAALEAAARSQSFERYIAQTGWMHPLYGELRSGLAAHFSGRTPLNARQERLIRLNLDRARALPADPGRRYVLVDITGAKLTMYEDGRAAGTMKVIVGRPDLQTPPMAGLMRYAMVNPYWHIPPDLVRDRIAPAVLKEGVSHLRTHAYQVTSDWSQNPRVVDPASVDWRAVAAGQRELPVRQLPGPNNGMGKMKFMFPNTLGIYLHDTPDKHLFKEADRRLSAGCVRVEDAPRLARWLFGRNLTTRGKTPEQQVDLPTPVPVYITYFTAMPEKGQIAFRPDVYSRDEAQLARR